MLVKKKGTADTLRKSTVHLKKRENGSDGEWIPVKGARIRYLSDRPAVVGVLQVLLLVDDSFEVLCDLPDIVVADV
jgi:hypothetical protein